MGDNPILGVGVCRQIFTWLVQSSLSGSIGILQELYSQGQISIEGALPVLFGNNIRITITAVLAAIGASVPAKTNSSISYHFQLSWNVCGHYGYSSIYVNDCCDNTNF